MDKVMDIKVDNALTAKEAKELSEKAVDAYVEQWLPDIMSEIFEQIRFAANNQRTYINDSKVLDDYYHKSHFYKCINTILEEMGYIVSKNENDYKIHISWFNAE